MSRTAPVQTPMMSLLAAMVMPFATHATTAAPLAPGLDRDNATSGSGCPTFRWTAPDAPVDIEIAVFRVVDAASTTLDGPIRIATRPGQMLHWTPEGEDCLGPGRYAWVMRAGAGDRWSDPLHFDVSERPSDAELRAAMATIERHFAATTPAATRDPARTVPAAKGADDITAVQGLVPDGSGISRGVHGVVASPDGVGVLAENTHANGFDLQLAGPVAALLSEREWRLTSNTPQTVNFTNPSGPMSLQVQGVTVVTTATDQNTMYVAGNQLSLVGTTFHVSEGAGSGLDADTVDGLHAAEIVAGAHDHFGQGWSGDTATEGLTVTNANAAGSGLRGVNTAATGFNHGVRGSASSVNGRGVFGEASAATGSAFGVFGISASVDGHGVHGRADALTGATFGVFGRSRSPGGVGGLFVNDGGGLLLAADNVAAPGLGFLEFSVDNSGNVIAESFAGDGSPLTGLATSLFDVFGGDGSDGARVVSGTESVPLRAQYSTLTLNVGSVLQTNSSDGRAYIAVQGRCTLRGTVDGRGRGVPGRTAFPAGSDGPGQAGLNAMHFVSRAEVPGCVSGASGGGGSALSYPGANGGGGEGDGGLPGNPAQSPGTWKRVGLSGGSHGLLSGATTTDAFSTLVACPGAGAASGSVANGDGTGTGTNVQGGGGGSGGAVIYLECGELEFVAGGVLDARGSNGGNALCTGAACSSSLDAAGGGGGGGGGVVLVRTRSIISNAGQVRVDGGAAGSGAGLGGNDGGAGAAGFADIVIVR